MSTDHLRPDEAPLVEDHGRAGRVPVRRRYRPFVPWRTYRQEQLRGPEPLLTVRAAVVLLVALVVGILAGGLSYLADHSVPASVLVGGGAGGGAIQLLQTVIGR